MEKLAQQIADLQHNYEMGFVTPAEFVMEYLYILQRLGAGDKLSAMVNDMMRGLAAHINGILGGSGKSIEDYKV